MSYNTIENVGGCLMVFLECITIFCRLWKLFVDSNLLTLRPKASPVAGRAASLFPSLTRLDLTAIRFDDEIISDIIRSATALSGLKRLDLLCPPTESACSIPLGITNLGSLRIMIIQKEEQAALQHNPIHIPKGLEKLLDLEELRFKGTTPDFKELSKLQRLRYLTLGRRQLGPSCLEGVGFMTGLWAIEITGNPLLAEIPAEISRLVSLRHFDIARNRIQRLPEEVGCITSLTTLIGNRNSMSEVPRSIGQLVHLVYLDLSNNALSSLPTSLTLLAALQTLDLSSNFLQSLPGDPGRLTSLINLHLDHNNMVDLSPGIGHMVQLRRLTVSHNYLEKLPSEVGHLSRLTHLSLSANGLTQLPETVSCLTALKHISVDQNDLEYLPQGIYECTNLAAVDLSFNRLRDVPAPMLGLKGLELYMEFNPFCSDVWEGDERDGVL